MKLKLFGLPGNNDVSEKISDALNADIINIEIREFPDKEWYIRVNSDVKDCTIILVCTLHEPNNKLFLIRLLADTLRENGAEKILLVAPYLAYMRQDIQFHPGEGITSRYTAKFISETVDSIITVDPHLHRYHTLSEVYSIPNKVVHASHLIADWIKNNIGTPVLIGPDSESHQWVASVASQAHAEFLVLEKKRYGDEQVSISIPDSFEAKDFTPVLVDDIISTGSTMIETAKLLKKIGLKKPVCIGIHAVFAGEGFTHLKNADISEIITCNTIHHSTNRIDISGEIIKGIEELLSL